jgi:hypothetical protein
MKLTALVVAVLCSISLLAEAQDSEASVEGKIIALEKLWNQAYKGGDTRALDAILDDSIVLATWR